MTEYYRTPEKFEAIQFTGGAENGAEVCGFLVDHTMNRASYVREADVVRSEENDTVIREKIVWRNRDYNVGVWFVKGDQTPGNVESLFDEDFTRLYSPKDVESPGKIVVEVASTGQIYEVREDGSYDDLDTGEFVHDMWSPRYFQTLGEDMRFFVGRDDGSLSEISRNDIPFNTMVHPISTKNVLVPEKKTQPKAPPVELDTGAFIGGIWCPRYFQVLGSDSRFYVGGDDGSLHMVAKENIPKGHMAYPISRQQLAEWKNHEHTMQAINERKSETALAILREKLRGDIPIGDPTPPPAEHYENNDDLDARVIHALQVTNGFSDHDAKLVVETLHENRILFHIG